MTKHFHQIVSRATSKKMSISVKARTSTLSSSPIRSGTLGTSFLTKASSPVKMTAEKMQMVRRDVKPGNGTSLLTYQNHANLRKHLAVARHLVDDRASDFYNKEKIAGPERYVHTRNKEMDELRRENNRLFGRLLNIYEVSSRNSSATSSSLPWHYCVRFTLTMLVTALSI